VWISRSNTPASSNPPSPSSSVFDEPNPAKAHPLQPENRSLTNIPQLSMPQPIHPYPGHPGERSRSASRSPEVPASGAASSEKLSRLPNISDDAIKIRVQQTYKPRQSSHLRFSSGDVLGIDTIHDPENKDNLSWGKLLRCALFYRICNGCNTDQMPDANGVFANRQAANTAAAFSGFVRCRQHSELLCAATARSCLEFLLTIIPSTTNPS
jgi:hypothetical protein